MVEYGWAIKISTMTPRISTGSWKLAQVILHDLRVLCVWESHVDGGGCEGGAEGDYDDDDQKIMMNMMTETKMRTQVLCSPPTAENGEEHLMLQQSAPDSKSWTLIWKKKQKFSSN